MKLLFVLGVILVTFNLFIIKYKPETRETMKNMERGILPKSYIILWSLVGLGVTFLISSAIWWGVS